MARTNPELVGGVIEVNADISLTQFIEDASSLVDELCTSSGYSEARLRSIETWLAAHLYSCRDKRTKRVYEAVGQNEVQISYLHKIGMFLAESWWGQQAMIMDTKGSLAILNKQTEEGKTRSKPAVYWAGTDLDCRC